MQNEAMLLAAKIAAAKTWIAERLKVGEATPFAILLGVAVAAELWDNKEEVFTDSEAAERVTRQAVDELIKEGRVRWQDDHLVALMTAEEQTAFEAGKTEGVAEERERILKWIVTFAYSDYVNGQGHHALLDAERRLRKDMSPTEREARVR